MAGDPSRVCALSRALALSAVCGALLCAPAKAQEPPTAETPYTAAFSVGCKYVTSLAVDPIVKFGVDPGSHMHSFIGNLDPDEWSTPDDLRKRGTNCSNPGDRSAYWVPSLYQRQLDNEYKEVPPGEVTIYYEGDRWGDHQKNAQIEPIPQGLVMITGSSAATSRQDAAIVKWGCPGGTIRPGGGPNCEPGSGSSGLIAFIAFPNCWDGRLDSDNHMDHLKHVPSWMPCPISHPTRIARIRMVINYFHTWGGPDGELNPVPGAVALSSGLGVYDGRALHSMHADFMDGWDRDALRQVHTRCITLSSCGVKVRTG
jgi:Domain of unknown function (DUF1996)